jgi:hypothetical protein
MIKEALVCLERLAKQRSATRLAITIADEFKAALVGLAIVDEPDIRPERDRDRGLQLQARARRSAGGRCRRRAQTRWRC